MTSFVICITRNSSSKGSQPACEHCARDFKQYGTVSEVANLLIIMYRVVKYVCFLLPVYSLRFVPYATFNQHLMARSVQGIVMLCDIHSMVP